MDNNLSCTIKNSELNVPKEKRSFLTYPALGLCPCTLEEREDGIELNFTADGMTSATSIRSKPRTDKLRFLINAAGLELLHKDYTFSLAPDNLMFDLNLCPHVLSRDLYCGGATYLQKYKALIGQLLAPRYSYADYLNGGEDLYRKQKFLAELAKLVTVAEIKACLETEFDADVKEAARTTKIVSKRIVILSQILIPVLAVILAATAFFAIRAIFFDMPHQGHIIEASQAYIAGDYIAAQVALRSVEPSEMAHETKHFLARSYVITEALTDEQKVHVLMGLTRMADGALFDFWIHLGRLEFGAAIDIAQRFGDSELLLFAYLKQRTFVMADTTIPGDERVSLLSYLENHINRIQGERDVDDVQEVGDEG